MTYSDIRNSRKKHRISQTKLAEYSGFTKQQISSWELEKDIPSEAELQKLKTTLEYLIEKVESGELNLTGHRIISGAAKKTKSHEPIKDAEDYYKRTEQLSYDSPYAIELSELFNKANNVESKKYVGIGLFSGCGGLDFGFEAAGVNIVGHVEVWDAANLIYEQNFPNSRLLKKDINDVSSEDIKTWKKEFGAIDIIVGGPPCQGFSLAGKRDPADIRNQLYKQYVRIVSELHPKAFVFENVAKMTSMKNKDGGLFLDEIIKDFSNVGYRIVHKIVNACDYGVPQSRERVIIVGVREDLKKKYSFSEPQFDSLEESNQITMFVAKQPLRTFRYATEDLCSLESDESSEVDPLHWTIAHPQHVIDWLVDTPEGMSAHENKDPAKRPPSGFNTTYKRIMWDEPCSTISTNFNMISGCRNVHPTNTRSLTIREATRAQSFPDEFVFCGKWGDVRTAIGNAVPPLLAYAIAKDVIKQVL